MRTKIGVITAGIVVGLLLSWAIIAVTAEGGVEFYKSEDGKWWAGVDSAGAFAGIDTKGLAVGGLKSTIARCKALKVNSKVVTLNLDFLLLSELHTIKSFGDVDAGIGISGIPFEAKELKSFGKLELYSSVGIGYSPDWFVGPHRIFAYWEVGGKWGKDGPDIEPSEHASKEGARFVAYVNTEIEDEG